MNCGRGKSGELGCYQILESNWPAWSKEAIGYVAPHTEGNEEYVVMYKIDKWLKSGLNASQVALKWNAGGAKQCSKGINSKGVAFDSCRYVQLAMNHYNK